MPVTCQTAETRREEEEEETLISATLSEAHSALLAHNLETCYERINSVLSAQGLGPERRNACTHMLNIAQMLRTDRLCPIQHKTEKLDTAMDEFWNRRDKLTYDFIDSQMGDLVHEVIMSNRSAGHDDGRGEEGGEGHDQGHSTQRGEEHGEEHGKEHDEAAEESGAESSGSWNPSWASDAMDAD